MNTAQNVTFQSGRSQPIDQTDQTIPSHPIAPLPINHRLIDRRQIWAANRFWMEMNNMKTKRYGSRGYHQWYTLLFMLKTFKFCLHATGFYRKGIQNTANIRLRQNALYFENLPQSFDGFTILHLSDLHLDCLANFERIILNTINDTVTDLCVLTGDYRTQLHGLNRHIIKKLEVLVRNIPSRLGFIGVLGNHDDCHMVNPLEQIGIHMLINASYTLHQNNEKIRIIGTDDVHYYYTDQALHALEHARDDFSILLIHSPEIYDMAEQMGVNLYLCGHTHAGQVCLPGGIPLFTHLNHGRRFYRGNWQHKCMSGFTHAGVGASGIPVRFNTQAEIVVHTLRRKTNSPSD